MEFVRFADLKPTWDIVKFDEGIEDMKKTMGRRDSRR